MALNEFDQIIEDGPQDTPPAGGSPFAEFVDDVEVAQPLKASMHVASSKQPDRQAEVMRLSKEMMLPPSVVDRQFDKVKVDRQRTQIDYGKFIDENPALSQWLSNPDNAGVAHDDVDAMKGVENTVKDYGMLAGSFNDQMSQLKKMQGMFPDLAYTGVSRVNASLGKLPALIYDVAAIPQNIVADSIGREQVRSPEWLRKNSFVEAQEEAALLRAPPEVSESVTEALSKGDVKKAGLILYSQVVANAPQQAAMIGASIVGSPMAGMAFAGATTAADVNAKSQESGATPLQATGNALLQGTIESQFERLGTLGVMKKWEGLIAKSYGKEMSAKVMGEMAKGLAYSMAAEGNEEALTSIAQDFSDYLTGVNPNALEGMLSRSLDAGLVGAASGGAITAPSASMSTFVSLERAKKTQMSQDFYMAFGTSAESMKLKERLPEAARNYVDQVTKGTGVENVFIPVDAAETYFQTKGINPITAMQEIGVLEAYTEAKQTGADIQIPLGLYAQKVVGTEHFEGLKNDVKFNQEDLTVNQLKSEKELTAETERQASQQNLPGMETIDQQAREIGGEIATQLREAGHTPDDAKLIEEYVKTQAIRNNLTPAEVFDMLPLSVRSGAMQPMADGTLNQAGDYAHIPITIDQENGSFEVASPTAKATGEILGENYSNHLSADGKDAPTKKSLKAIESKYNNVWKLDTVNVNPSSRGSGSGAAVLDSVIRDAKANGADAIILNASPMGSDGLGLQDLTKFYESRGFKVVDKYKDQNATMVLDLSQAPETLFQGGQDPRGQITFQNGQALITLGSARNASTFVHEAGHYFLEIQKILASREGAPDQVKQDWQETLKFLGVESADQITRDQHEKFAEAWEVYAAEGKAPSSALRRTFARFKVWMVSVYRTLSGQGKTLPDDVRGLFDRMIATDEAILEVSGEMNRKPMDKNALGMSDEQFEKYERAQRDAALAANEKASSDIMKVYDRERTKWYQAEVAKETEAVTQELQQQKVYWATSILQKGELPGGSALPDGATKLKIDRKSFVEKYGADAGRAMPRGVLVSSGGLHYGVVSDILGFNSGGDLVAQLLEAPPLNEAIKTEVNRRMENKYPDILLPMDMSNGPQQSFGLQTREEALEAIHNNDQAKLIRMELKHMVENNLPVVKDLIRRVAKRMPTDKQVRQQAVEIIAKKKANDIKPINYARAEAKARREAGILLAKGDVQGAIAAKNKELLNHELYRAAIDAQDYIEKAFDKFDRFTKSDEKLSKTRDTDIINGGRAVLSLFGLAESERGVESYLSNLKSQDPDGYQTVMALVAMATERVGPWEDLSFDDFVALTDTMDAFWDLSKTRKQIDVEGEKRNLDEVKEELMKDLSALQKPGASDGYKRKKTEWDKTIIRFLGAKASMRRVESWADSMGENFKKYIYRPVSEAVTKYRSDKPEYQRKIRDILQKLAPSLDTGEIKSPELGFAFKNKAMLLGAVLHSGNDSNLSKLLRGYGWGQIDAANSLDRSRWDAFIKRMWSEGVLTKQDYDAVQELWDLNEQLKAPAQRAHKEMYGYYFNEITANEIVTPFGTYRGGYVPAVADPFDAPDAANRSEREQLENSNNSFMFPTTGRGFTKERVDLYAAPLMLDLGMIGSHVDKVLRFIHIEPAIKQVARLVKDRSFAEALHNFDPVAESDMLNPWLQRSAQQMVSTPMTGRGGQFLDNAAKGLRRRVGMQVMFANLTNALQQLTGFSISAVKVDPKYLTKALWRYMRAPGLTTEAMTEKSAFMKTRTSNESNEIQAQIDKIIMQPTVYDKAQDWAAQHTYFIQSAMQNVVDTTTWMGAYEQAVEQGHTEDQAVRDADEAVRLTQGSMNPEDVSKYESGPAVLRLFTMFYSYFNMQANLLGTEFSKIQREQGLRKGLGRGLYLYTMGLMIPAVMAEILVKAMAGRLDEDDDDEYLDDILAIFFGSQARALTAMIPYGGQVANLAWNATNDKWYDDKISMSPAVQMLESATIGNFKNIYRASQGEEVSGKRAIQDALTAVGLATGLPTASLARPLGYLSDYSEGKVQPEGPVDFIRGLTTGKTGQPR